MPHGAGLGARKQKNRNGEIVSLCSASARKLTLSIKARETAEEKQAMADFGSSDSGASLGDILGAALAKRDSDDDK